MSLPATTLLAAVERVHVRFEWAGLPAGDRAFAALAVAAAVGAAVLLLYRGERGGARRWPACALRLGALAVLGLLLLRPSVARDVETKVPGRVVVLADRSASMSVDDPQMPDEEARAWAAALGLGGADEARAVPREEVLRRLLAGGTAPLLGRLSARDEVEVVAFADDARRVLGVASGAPSPALPEWRATGKATALAAALDGALEGDRKPAAVVLLSDGRETAGGDAEAAAARAGQAGVPVLAVGIGSAEAPRNAAFVGLVADEMALRGLPLRMEAVVRSAGLGGAPTELVLTAAPAEGQGQATEVVRKAVALRDGRQVLDLTHVPVLTGRVAYVARLEPVAGESRTADNEARRVVTVSERQVRVLMVAGGPDRDVQFISSLLRRNPDFDVQLVMPGGSPVPAPEGYDVVLLWDPAPDLVAEDWLDALAGLVGEGRAGLAVAAGPTHTTEMLLDPRMAALRELLPVTADEAALRGLVAAAGPFVRPLAVLPGDDMSHPILAVEPESDALQVWRGAPALYWVLPAGPAKRGATVLLRAEGPAPAGGASPVPLVAVQPYGMGRVFYCGTPETWRWRSMGIGDYEGFWLAALRYCGGAVRRTADGGGSAIILERDEYEVGEPVAVRARLLDADPPYGGPLARTEETLAVTLDGREAGKVELVRLAGGEMLEGAFTPEEFGRYALAWSGPDGQSAEAGFEVRAAEAELADVRAAREVLRALADRSGGRYFGPDELGALPAAVPDRSQVTVEAGPLEPAWDRAVLLALLVCALGGEWLLRKLLGMA